MKIKMKVSIASPDWSYAPGDIAEFDDNTAKKFIKNGFAEPLEGEKKTSSKRGGKRDN